MKPTAFQVATAIVAACKETGEDPVICADQQTASIRARHYVLWALLHVFQEMKPGEAVLACGVNGKPMSFYHNSRMNLIPGKRPGGWAGWNPEAYARVIAAIEATVPAPPTSVHRTPRVQREPSTDAGTATPVAATPAPYKNGPLPAVKNSRQTPTKWSGSMDRGGLRPAPGTAERVIRDDEDDAVFDQGTIGPSVRMQRGGPLPKSKREMEDDLRRAVQNTAAKTPPRDE